MGQFTSPTEANRPNGGQVLRIENLESVPEPDFALGVVTLGALGVWLRKKRATKPLLDKVVTLK
jgi:hypothetical protein